MNGTLELYIVYHYPQEGYLIVRELVHDGKIERDPRFEFHTTVYERVQEMMEIMGKVRFNKWPQARKETEPLYYESYI